MFCEQGGKPQTEDSVSSVELGLPTAARDVQLAERVEVTRELFHSRMRHVAFASWEELLAALAERPVGQGYAALRGESNTVIKLDPLRVFGWVATLMMNVGAWGLMVYVFLHSKLAALLFTGLYGGALWLVASRALAPQLAGLLWPSVPMAAAVMGFISVSLVIGGHDPGEVRADGLLLLLSALPHALATLVLIRGLPSDPDRATLVMNAFVGAIFVLHLSFVQLGAHGLGLYRLDGIAVLGLSLASVAAAGRLFAVPGAWGSAELVSWTLNLGTLGAFTSVQLLLDLPYTADWWAWVVYLPVPFALMVLGAVFDRSFPVLLSAISFLQITVYASWLASTACPPSSSLSLALGTSTFGTLGVGSICLAQAVLKSRQWAQLTVDLRCCLARACGCSEPSHFWSQTASAPLEGGPAVEGQLL